MMKIRVRSKSGYRDTLVDDEDYYSFAKYKWQLDKDGYVEVKIKNKHTKLHKVVAERIGIYGQVDHIDRDKLNNQRYNLRAATNSQNQHNRTANKNKEISYKGVFSKGNKFYSQIRFKNICYNLGTFNTPEEAALAYNRKATELHGEYACLNEIRSQ